MSQTHQSNVPDSRGMNAYHADPSFAALLSVYVPKSLHPVLEPQLERMGALVGDRLEQLALAADKNPPTLSLRDRTGAAVQRIEKHPAYEELERYAFGEFGLAAMSHRGGVFGTPDKLHPMAKYALVYLFVQAEFGLCCPLSMTDSLTRTLRKFGSNELVSRYLDRLTSQDMDNLFQGAMFMTEQAAGSDVGAVETVARQQDGGWKLYGDKWFCSNPDAALAMVLARPEGGESGTRGLSLFLLPRHLPDGRLNDYRIIRLKDKMGTRSMASGEIVLEGAEAYLVGEAGQGFKQMTDMINMSRLANGVRSAGLMRRSVAEALHISRHRRAFGKSLMDMPLMRRQLAKMLLAAEQGRSMVFHTAQVLDAADRGDAEKAKVLRILTPLVKFRACRDARKVAGDAMEVRGGCGYIEEWSDARVLRDAHLGSIWEGTSNIVALDVLRAARREGAFDALDAHLRACLSEIDAPLAERLGAALDRVAALLRTTSGQEGPAEASETRRAASAVYNIASAVFLAWEGARLAGSHPAIAADRQRLADLVLTEKLGTRDPLAPAAPEPDWLPDVLARAGCDAEISRIAAE
ncbi:acyl-CoA dehydrogenase family protein [Salipiger sp. PrR002]|uniref:acyl-CoA dehydrogenase family protein n=1 Tax=Salipiger sp. PrR002 TaxID=2706489 RepID=UPI0013BD6A86|nr:acyl-CoA dehydrogenase family protein [Salipiger sp. PrR002]NDW02256.1 DNA alkylation response protein [Salipiger sp. PrR002]NDW59259.1 DNA alkylation response protein [Salipiger sp. PrR004]